MSGCSIKISKELRDVLRSYGYGEMSIGTIIWMLILKAKGADCISPEWPEITPLPTQEDGPPRIDKLDDTHWLIGGWGVVDGTKSSCEYWANLIARGEIHFKKGRTPGSKDSVKRVRRKKLPGMSIPAEAKK